MSQYTAAELQRGESGVGPFPIASGQNLRLWDVVETDLTARNAIEEWRRKPYMVCYVVATGLEYRLGADVTIAGQVWTEIVHSDPDALVHDDILTPEGYIKPELMQNLFINDSFVVDSEAAMLALTTVTGNAVIRTDTGEVFIKLNNDDPSDITDFADITGNTGAVTSVNGMTGAVSVTIANLLAVPANQTDFDAAVGANATVLSHSASIASLTTNKADLVAGTVPLSQLPYVFDNGITRSSNEVKLGGSLLYDTTFTLGGFNWTFDATGAGDVGLNFGSDAPYDIIYRTTSGKLGRLPIGTIEGQVLKVSSGTLIWSNDLGGTTGSSVAWGSILGTITDQVDLVAYLVANYLALSGGTLTGFLTLNANPTTNLHAATKQYVDSMVVGLWDDRGNFNASGGSYPSSGGSGTAGAILKGDIWTISVGGTLPTAQVVEPGDTVRALVDTPGNTQANWAIAQNNIGYTPITNVLNSAQILVGSSGNIATARSMTGDISIDNLGATSYSGTVPVTKGGTGFTTATQGDLIYGSASNTFSKLAKDTNATRYLSNTGSSNNPAWAQVDLSNGVTGTLLATNGGTGFASYAVGDLLYASTTSALSKLADVAVGSYLRSGGVNTAPLWSTLILPNAATTDRIVYATGTNTWGESGNFTFSASSAVLTLNASRTILQGTFPSSGPNGYGLHITGGHPGGNNNDNLGIFIISGSSTIGPTSAFNYRSINNSHNVTTGATNQIYYSYSVEGSRTISHTGATVYGINYVPTFSGAQLSTLTHAAWRHTVGYVQWGSVVSPTQLTSNQNDYNPSGWTSTGAPYGASIVRHDVDSTIRDLTGFTGGVDGRISIHFNTSANTLRLKHDASSTAANRYYLPNNTDIDILKNAGWIQVYDNASQRNRVIGLGPPPISLLLAATATNTINNAANKQEWQWNTWDGTTHGFLISSNTTSLGASWSDKSLFNVSLTGSQNSSSALAVWISNARTGTTTSNYALALEALGASANNVALYVSAGQIVLNSTVGINDVNNNELIKFSQTSSAVNELTITNAITGNPTLLSATGGDSNIALKLSGKGTKGVILVGFTDASSAAAGEVGEQLISTVSTFTNFTTTATYQQIATISLTAGDWDITVFYDFSVNSSTLTASANAIYVISTTTASAAGATEGLNIAYVGQAGLNAATKISGSIATYRVTISSTTSYYLNGQATFTGGNPQFAGTITARRIR